MTFLHLIPRKYLPTLILLAIAFSGSAQTGGKIPIDSFAIRQNGLFRAAYEKKDLIAYARLMKEWESAYEPLTPGEKKRLAGYAADAYYNYSCTFALLGNKTSALDCLQKSIRYGYTNYAHIRGDADLISLHNDPGFIATLASLRSTGDYMYILSRADGYNTGDNRPYPAFTYQDAASPDLQTLRRSFNLDSIAGTGNDASRALSLLHWIHNLIPHDGNHENPVVKNALSLIAVCRQDARGLNCRGLATVLNECYLATGFRSRLVTCLPKDSLGTDFDCHVIVMVFIPSLKKWIWTDPTNDAYVMNESGELLGIEEVRMRLIHHQPLILNPDANWNHQSSTLKEDYLYNYMAKNLYMLECPLNSEYDNETGAIGKSIPYVRLLPLDYFKQTPNRQDIGDPTKGTTLVVYKTNDPGKFWSAPPPANSSDTTNSTVTQ